jgi:hypothetical protein
VPGEHPLFRTAFFAGYPIVERHPMLTGILYEQNAANQVVTALAGLDATVYVPRSTSIQERYRSLAAHGNLRSGRGAQADLKFYSTRMGERRMETTGLQNIVEPEEAVYKENPELSKGEINQIDWAGGRRCDGHRTVMRMGVYLKDTFHTHSLPGGMCMNMDRGRKYRLSRRGQVLYNQVDRESFPGFKNREEHKMVTKICWKYYAARVRAGKRRLARLHQESWLLCRIGAQVSIRDDIP